ncbi:hypothetical protein [uncultured Aquimarina sp.]|uniref:hypothetical protein n=1 Tax=uncultured Aquimarina sp. TaxID=575652 RepID=UPI002633A7D9|nr:hypothetical protein [uncultured Aquimarina sp.]
MNKLILTIFVLMNFGCIGQNGKKALNTSENDTTQVINLAKKDFIKTLKELKSKSDSLKSYGLVKSQIKKAKLKLNNKELSIDSISNVFKHSLINRIILFWEGTEWSFEGHTSIPRKGKIACGYFVSTTLKDTGINLNRYKLAQQSPVNEAKSLALNTPVIEIAESSIEQNILMINKSLKDGIHFIGFDASHVGYILKESGHLYLIHSNYIDYKGVEIEKIEDSIVFASYNKFYLAEISTNEELLKSWIKGNEISVVH